MKKRHQKTLADLAEALIASERLRREVVSVHQRQRKGRRTNEYTRWINKARMLVNVSDHTEEEIIVLAIQKALLTVHERKCVQ